MVVNDLSLSLVRRILGDPPPGPCAALFSIFELDIFLDHSWFFVLVTCCASLCSFFWKLIVLCRVMMSSDP